MWPNILREVLMTQNDAIDLNGSLENKIPDLITRVLFFFCRKKRHSGISINISTTKVQQNSVKDDKPENLTNTHTYWFTATYNATLFTSSKHFNMPLIKRSVTNSESHLLRTTVIFQNFI